MMGLDLGDLPVWWGGHPRRQELPAQTGPFEGQLLLSRAGQDRQAGKEVGDQARDRETDSGNHNEKSVTD